MILIEAAFDTLYTYKFKGIVQLEAMVTDLPVCLFPDILYLFGASKLVAPFYKVDATTNGCAISKVKGPASSD